MYLSTLYIGIMIEMSAIVCLAYKITSKKGGIIAYKHLLNRLHISYILCR